MSDNLVFKLLMAVIESRAIGDHDNIYIVADGIIGKRCRNEDRAHNEYNIGKYLIDNGIQVPKMYQLITPCVEVGCCATESRYPLGESSGVSVCGRLRMSRTRAGALINERYGELR